MEGKMLYVEPWCLANQFDTYVWQAWDKGCEAAGIEGIVYRDTVKVVVSIQFTVQLTVLIVL